MTGRYLHWHLPATGGMQLSASMLNGTLTTREQVLRMLLERAERQNDETALVEQDGLQRPAGGG